MIEVVDRNNRVVLVRPEAVDAVEWAGEGRQVLTLYLRCGYVIHLRDDYGFILARPGAYGDVLEILGAKVTRKHPSDLHDIRAKEIQGNKQE